MIVVFSEIGHSLNLYFPIASKFLKHTKQKDKSWARKHLSIIEVTIFIGSDSFLALAHRIYNEYFDLILIPLESRDSGECAEPKITANKC
jgi:hypothetical protein